MTYAELFKNACAALETAGVKVDTPESGAVRYRIGDITVATGQNFGRTDFWTSLDKQTQGLIAAHHTLYHNL